MIDLVQQRGSIAQDVDAASTAKSLLTLMVGLRVLARGAFDATGLLAIQSSALMLIGHWAINSPAWAGRPDGCPGQAQRQVSIAITTQRIQWIVALASTLRRCPYCGSNNPPLRP